MTRTWKSLWARPFAALTAAGLAVGAVAVVWSAVPGTGAAHAPGSIVAVYSSEIRLLAAAVPDRAYQTLKLIDAGEWPDAAHAPGTEGGRSWQDREGRLPGADGGGTPIRYQEWDVNPKQAGHNRDAERIITGSDGSAWYTGDHYVTFTRMR